MNVRDLVHVAFDCETTGVEPGRFINAPTRRHPERKVLVPRCEMIDVGAVVFEPEHFEVVRTFTTMIRPRYPEFEQDEARKVHGYTHNDWKHAPYIEKAVSSIRELLSGRALVIHADRFDWTFLYIAGAVDMGLVPIVYDTKSMARAMLQNRLEIKGFSASEIRKALGLPPEPQPHTGLRGAYSTYEMFRRLVVAKSDC